MLKYKYIFQMKYTEAILSNSVRKLLWFQITKMLIADEMKKNYCVIYYNFRHTFAPYGNVVRRKLQAKFTPLTLARRKFRCELKVQGRM